MASLNIKESLIKRMAHIEFETTDTWEVYFRDEGADPFSGDFEGWFPATDCSFRKKSIKSSSIGIYSHPDGINKSELSVTFVDNADRTITTWIQNWIDSISNDAGTAVAPLDQCLKECVVVKYNRQLEPVELHQLYVYPTSALEIQGKSSAELCSYTVSFEVCGCKTT